MEMLKGFIKGILGGIAGLLIGFMIAATFVVCLTDMTYSEFFAKFSSLNISEGIMAFAVAIFGFVISYIILIPVHEAGHLVCGLLSGYRFVSFRVLNLTFIRIDGKLRIKRFSIAGTGGQCLLLPPDLPLERIPAWWYLFGGVLANLICLFAALPLLWIKGHPLLTEAVAMFIIADLIILVMNGIPMKISGAGNDAYNMTKLKKNPLSKLALLTTLRTNALIQNGVRPKDMPGHLFVVAEDIDYSNQLEVSLPLLAASRLVDEMRYPEALEMFEEIYTHKDEIVGIYVKEIACELLFLRLVQGDIEGAKQLFDPELRKYIEMYRKVMSSKERILCAVYLLMDNDREKALATYENLRRRENDYLLQGEVKSDLALMEALLSGTAPDDTATLSDTVADTATKTDI